MFEPKANEIDKAIDETPMKEWPQQELRIQKLRVSSHNKREQTFYVRFIDDELREQIISRAKTKMPNLADNEVALLEYINKNINLFTHFTDEEGNEHHIPVSTTIKDFERESKPLHPALRAYDVEKEGIFIGKNILTSYFENKNARIRKLVSDFEETIEKYAAVLKSGRKFNSTIAVYNNNGKYEVLNGFLRFCSFYNALGSEKKIWARSIPEFDIEKYSKDELVYVENNARTQEQAWETFISQQALYEQYVNEEMNNSEIAVALSISRAHFYSLKPALKCKALTKLVQEHEVTISTSKAISLLKAYAKEHNEDDLIEMTEDEVLSILNKAKVNKTGFNHAFVKKLLLKNDGKAISELQTKIANLSISEKDIDTDAKIIRVFKQLLS